MSYAMDRKLENFYVLRNYITLYKRPIREVDYKWLVDTQNKKIQLLMERAWEIPFYRARFEASGTKPSDYKTAADLYRFPILTKDELRTWMDEEATQNPKKYACWHVSPTSGSTGRVLRVLFSPKEQAWITANWLRVLSMPGYNPFTGKTMSRPNPHAPVKGEDSMVQRLGILRRKQMLDVTKNQVTSAQLLQEINDYKPDYLYNFKHLLVRIAAYAKKTGAYCHKPKFYTPVGETIDDVARALLIEVFGSGLVDAYGMTETGSSIVRLPNHDEYQINSDTHVVNIYTSHPLGGGNGVAVITPLFKTELPIINYFTGDIMDTYQRKGIRFVKKIKGRMNDVIKHKNGEVTEWNIVEGIMNWLSKIVQYRIIQEDYSNITMLLVREPSVPEAYQPELEKQLIENLGVKLLRNEFRFHFEWCDEIPSDPSGKLRVLISKVK